MFFFCNICRNYHQKTSFGPILAAVIDPSPKTNMSRSIRAISGRRERESDKLEAARAEAGHGGEILKLVEKMQQSVPEKTWTDSSRILRRHNIFYYEQR